jgi:hypothetical protein
MASLMQTSTIAFGAWPECNLIKIQLSDDSDGRLKLNSLCWKCGALKEAGSDAALWSDEEFTVLFCCLDCDHEWNVTGRFDYR